MKKGIVVEGDPLSSGGKVTQGSGTMVNGLKIALLGDPVSCPIPFHGSGTIVEGNPNVLICGKPVALEGHKVSCGCTLLAKLVGNNFKIGISLPSEPSITEKIDGLIDSVKDKINWADDKIDRAVVNTLDKILPKPIKDMNDIVKPYICALPEFPVTLKKVKLPVLKQVISIVEQAFLAKELYCFDRSHYKNNSGNKTSLKDQNKLEYVPLEGRPKELKCEGNRYTAGRHSQTTKPPGDKLDSHHMPAKSAYFGSKMNPDGRAMKGPALKVEIEDHHQTMSHGWQGEEGRLYRQKQHDLIQQGKLKEAVQMDFDDLRKIAADSGQADKYECGIKEFIETYNKNDPLDFTVKNNIIVK